MNIGSHGAVEEEVVTQDSSTCDPRFPAEHCFTHFISHGSVVHANMWLAHGPQPKVTVIVSSQRLGGLLGFHSRGNRRSGGHEQEPFDNASRRHRPSQHHYSGNEIGEQEVTALRGLTGHCDSRRAGALFDHECAYRRRGETLDKCRFGH